ncbi:MAG: RNA polymerase sigma factor [Archangiaceae bacterium]|nr:RNA polymerase sigma factor [Archangiaceae bacterium]
MPSPHARPSPSPRTADVAHLPSGVPDAVLVERAREHDRGAESLLYRRHAGALLAMSGRMLRNSHLAEDTVQDAFVRAFERLHQLKDASMFRSWLLSILVSLVKKRLRRQRLLTWVGLEALTDVSLEQQAASHLDVEARLALKLLDQKLKELPAAHALAWSLRYVEGEKLEDVATAMKKSLATTKRYIAAAEQHLRAQVAMEIP